jgi:hypothetical protein
VHEYLTPGRNQVQLVVEPGPTPARTFEAGRAPLAVPAKMFARLRVMHMPAGTFPEDEGVRMLLNLDFAPPAGTPLPVPVILNGEVGSPPWVPRWAWPEARLLPEGEAVRGFVLNFLNRIVVSMNQGDLEPYLTAAQIRFNEISAAYQLPVEQQLESFRRQFARISAEPGFQMQPIDAATAELRYCGEGRVLECLTKDWRPLLRSVPRPDGSSRYQLPTKLAIFNRDVCIIR